MYLGYNTNGLAHHRLTDAIRLLADIGYRSVALTLDHAALNPFDPQLGGQQAEVRRLLDGFGMRSVIETGARYLLNPHVKHDPTLLSDDERARERRIDFLRRAIDVAAELQSDCVSLWSGALPAATEVDTALERLADGLRRVLMHARERDISLAFEPEPGMFVDTMGRFQRLLQWIDDPALQLTLDVGHLYCQGEVPIADYIEEWGPRIVNVHIEDMRAGVHEHLMFGEGEMVFPPILEAFSAVGYRGPLHVELSRHSHDAPRVARAAYAFLKPALDTALEGG